MHTVKPRIDTKSKEDRGQNRRMVVLPHMKGVTERITRVLKSYDVAAASSPYNTIRNELVHQRTNGTNLTPLMPSIRPHVEIVIWVYIGETERKFGTRLEEHKSVVEKVSSKIATRAGRKESLTNTYNQRSPIMWQIKIMLLVWNRLPS